MTHDEMRFLRREIINLALHNSWVKLLGLSLTGIKEVVRYNEINKYGQELKAYK